MDAERREVRRMRGEVTPGAGAAGRARRGARRVRWRALRGGIVVTVSGSGDCEWLRIGGD